MQIRYFHQADYLSILQAMRQFTDTRTETTPDELWVVEHLPVYTLGQASKPEHILLTTEIPVIQSDRGGQVTYHGPGQLIIYILINLKKKQLYVRQLISHIENSVIRLLSDQYHLSAYARADAPGVYINQAKICSIGLRIRKGCSYHGLALNVNMNLSPFSAINPCGYAGLKMTQLKDFNIHTTPDAVGEKLILYLKNI